MICAATDYHAELEKAWRTYVTRPDFKLWNVSINWQPNYRNSDDDIRKVEYVSVVDHKVIGYLSILVDRSTRSIADISAANFEKHPQFSKDFLTFLKRCRKEYRVIRWACVAGHPNEKFYEAICRRYGGRKVGVFTKKIKLHDGRLYDEAWYELVK